MLVILSLLPAASALSFSAPTTWTGAAEVGCRVSAAGDVDADGHDDLLVSDCAAQTVSVHMGSSAGIDPTPALTLTGEGGGRFGSSLSGGGDLDGDGYDDVVIGAPRARGGRGCVYVLYGSSAGLVDSTTPLRCGGATTDAMGGNVAILGDVNGDGLDDMAWSPRSGNTGSLRVHHGNTAGVSYVASRSIALAGYVNSSGEGLRGAGDVNGDGYDDLVLGSPRVDGNAGSVTLFYGSAVGITPSASLRIDITDTYGAWTYYAGWSVDGAGDLDDDGYGDLLVSLPYDIGGVGILWGSATGIDWADVTWLGVDYGTWTYGLMMGYSVSGGAHLDDYGDPDGRPDFVAGLPGYWGDLGFGGMAAWSGDDLADITAGWQVASYYSVSLGGSVAILGDVDGDGCDDIASGNSFYAGRTDTDVYPTLPIAYGVSVYYSTDCPLEEWSEYETL